MGDWWVRVDGIETDDGVERLDPRLHVFGPW